MAHSRGVILRNRAAGVHRWRDEADADGGKRHLRRQVKRRERRQWQADAGLTTRTAR